MATIMAGGARRSAAPTYQAYNPRQALALNEDPDLLRQQIFEQANPVAAPVAAVSKAGGLGSLSESFGRGTNTLSGQGANASFGGTPGVNAGTVGRVGAGLSALGSLTGNADAAQLGGMLGLGGALGSARTPQQALGVMAGPVASMMGVPAGALGVGMGLMQGDISKTINSALSLANPALAAANALSNVLGIGTLGGALAGTAGGFNANGSYDPGTMGLISNINPNIAFGRSYATPNVGVVGSYASPPTAAMISNPVRPPIRNSGGSGGGYGSSRGPGGSSGESGAAAGGAGPGGPGGY